MNQDDLYNTFREIVLLLTVQHQKELRPFHLTNDQYDTLLLLESATGQRMGDLCQRTLNDNSKMTRIVDYLEAMGWAERRSDPDDRRAQRVLITAAGAAQRTAVAAAHQRFMQSQFAVLNAAQQAQLEQLLALLRQSLRDRYDP